MSPPVAGPGDPGADPAADRTAAAAPGRRRPPTPPGARAGAYSAAPLRPAGPDRVRKAGGSAMDPARYRRLRTAFADVCDLPPEAREGAIRRICRGDRDMERDLVALLRESDAPAVDLERARPPTGTAVELLAGAVDALSGRPPSPPRDHPATIGPYRVLGLLGEGGAGVVYRCEQPRPRRTVAVKLLRRATPRMRRRFDLEMEVLGRLEHPGIARVLEGGMDEGDPYIAMELVHGEPIDAYARVRELDPAARLELVEQVAAAVGHAHRRGVVHRDLKPANVLVSSDGRVKVLDFGVARVLDASDARATTLAGMMLGTPAYMSPEQVAGDPGRVDTRADVYALGVLAFELLAGRLPYGLPADAPPSRILAAVSHGPVIRAGDLDRRLRGDLETVLERAMAVDPERRTPSADALAADLARWRRGEPIEARRDSMAYVMRRRLARSRGVIAVALLGLVATSVLAVAAGRQATRAGHLATLEATARTEAERLAAAEAEARGAAEAARAQAVAAREDAESQRDEARAVTAFLVDVFGLADPDVSRAPAASGAEILELAGAAADGAFDGRPRAEAEVRAALGRALLGLGRPAAARNELLRALTLLRTGPDGELEPVGPGEPRLDLPRDELAARHAIRWPLVQAMEDLYDRRRQAHERRAAAEIRALLAPVAPALAAALAELHRASTGGLDDGLPAPIAEVIAAAGALAPDDAESWTILADHLMLEARRLRRERRYEPMLALVDASLEAYRRFLPETNTRITRATQLRFLGLRIRGRAAEAEREGRALLDRLRERLGPGHRHLATIHRSLAYAMIDLDRPEEAIAELRAGIRIADAHDPSSLIAVQLRARLVLLLEAAGGEAELPGLRTRLAETAAASPMNFPIAFGRRSLRPEQAGLEAAWIGIFRALRAGDPEAAGDRAEAMLAELEHLAIDDPRAAVISETQAWWVEDLLMMRGPDDVSRRMIEGAVAVARASPWLHPRKQADAWYRLGLHRLAEGRPSDALAAGERSRTIAAEMDEPRPDIVARAEGLMGRAWDELGEPERARPLLARAVDAMLVARPVPDYDLTRMLRWSVDLHARHGRPEDLVRTLGWLIEVHLIEGAEDPTAARAAWRVGHRDDLPADLVADAARLAELALIERSARPDVLRAAAATRLRAGDVEAAAALLPMLLLTDGAPESRAIAALVRAAERRTEDARTFAAAFARGVSADPAADDASTASDAERAVDVLVRTRLGRQLAAAGLLD